MPTILWNILQEIVSGTADTNDNLIILRNLIVEIWVTVCFIITCCKHQRTSQISLRAGDSHVDSFNPTSYSIWNRCWVVIEQWPSSQMGPLVPLITMDTEIALLWELVGLYFPFPFNVFPFLESTVCFLVDVRSVCIHSPALIELTEDEAGLLG